MTPEQEYFSDGISEEILNELAQLPGLRVASRTSAFTFKGDNRNMGEIAETLKVDHVLEGSVRKSGNRVRIAAQLIDASNEKHLWSETYDRELINIFAIQSEIAQAVARKIEIELSPREKALLASTRSIDPVAHEAYLRGQYEAARFTPEGFTKAIEHYRKGSGGGPGVCTSACGPIQRLLYARSAHGCAAPPRSDARGQVGCAQGFGVGYLAVRRPTRLLQP